MGCSGSIRPTESIVINKKDHVINSQSLIEACRSGDINRVTILLKTITPNELNKADWITGDTPLHLATYHNHIDIVRLLLNHGSMRNILNYEKQIPANYATTIEMKKLFQRSTNDYLSRFVSNDANKEENEKIEWSLNSLDATQFFMEYESQMSLTGQWNIIQTIETLQKASELENISHSNSIWNLFEQAREKTDAKYLIRALTVESKFYKILNKKLTQQYSKKSMHNDKKKHEIQNTMTIFNQGFAMAQSLLTEKIQTDNTKITNWVHRYLGTIHTLIYQPIFQFNGLTYRAKRFLEESIPSDGQIPVMCIYYIDSYTSFKVMDIHTVSEYPDEEEIIIFPGIPFEIRKIHRNKTMNMIEIELIPMLSTFENI